MIPSERREKQTRVRTHTEIDTDTATPDENEYKHQSCARRRKESRMQQLFGSFPFSSSLQILHHFNGVISLLRWLIRSLVAFR